MFSNLLSFWKGKDFLTQVIGQFKSMLDNSEQMYDLVCQSLLENAHISDLKGKVYALDKEVNLWQREIRKRIVTHMSLQPTIDANASLLLMSVVKDAERLGDYAKNLYEVTCLLEKPLDVELFHKHFNGIDKEIKALFEQTKKAFIDSDDTVAEGTFNSESRIAKKCDLIVEELAKSDLSTNEAVCMVLIARHFKRIAAHLVNIATSVILPLDEIDYFDEKHIND